MNTELKQRIKNLIEELNYRTDQKSAEELKKLSAELYEAAIELVFVEKMPKVEAPQAEPPKQKPTTAAPIATEPKKPVVDLFANAEMEVEPEPVEVVQVVEAEKPIVEKVEASVSAGQEKGNARNSKTLNDSFHAGISIGFNDRFAFVHKLFDGSEDEYYRVLSQLNTMTNFKEAVAFLDNVVKPDYHWADKEEFETRLKEILAHHFS